MTITIVAIDDLGISDEILKIRIVMVLTDNPVISEGGGDNAKRTQ
ncbi:unnamed protein product, partial [marine sediment metagenome]